MEFKTYCFAIKSGQDVIFLVFSISKCLDLQGFLYFHFHHQIKDLESQLADGKKKMEKMTSIKQELDTLKLARRSSEVRIQELQRELAENQQKATYNKKDVQHLEEKLHKVRERAMKLSQY